MFIADISFGEEDRSFAHQKELGKSEVINMQGCLFNGSDL